MLEELFKNNLFATIAEHLWANGADGEQIARDLAIAFKFMVVEGRQDAGELADDIEEYKRFTSHIPVTEQEVHDHLLSKDQLRHPTS